MTRAVQMSRHMAAFALVSIGLVGNAFAWSGVLLPLQTEYRSDSNQFVLRLTLSHRHGYGGGEHYLLKNNKEVWRKRLPFALYEARVLDDGTVAGYGYTHGLNGTGGEYREPRDHGDLVVLLLDPTGNIKLKEAYHRKYGKWVRSGQSPEPMVDDIIVDPDNDRLVFLVNHENYDWSAPMNVAWRQFQLSTGKPLGIFYPEERQKESQWLRVFYKARPLPGTPLLVVQWYRKEGKLSYEDPPISGTHFALLDKQCNPVWQLTLRDDYEFPTDEEREKQIDDWIAENSAILSVDAPGRFDLFFAKESKRVSFVAKENEKGQWVVTEIGRKDFRPVMREEKDPDNKSPIM